MGALADLDKQIEEIERIPGWVPKEDPTPGDLSNHINEQVIQRYNDAEKFLEQAYPHMTKSGREARAAEIACMNRKERRRNGIR